MDNLQLLDRLVTSSSHLAMIIQWLHEEVWSSERYKMMKREDFLLDGEKRVYEVEELLLEAAPGLYNELAVQAEKPRNLVSFLTAEPQRALVILDGASFRELPMLELMARQTGYEVVKLGGSFAALPSETTPFVAQRILGKEIAPIELPRRRELVDRHVLAWHYDAVFRTFSFTSDMNHLLLWSQFPDSSYKDLGARFSSHFEQMPPLYEQVWKNMVMQIPHNFEIIITSDHGYIFFGQGLDSKHIDESTRILNQARNKYFSQAEQWPEGVSGLQLFPNRRLAMLRGRIKNRPQGPAAGHAYRHGGFSLMEMLTPWLIIKKR